MGICAGGIWLPQCGSLKRRRDDLAVPQTRVIGRAELVAFKGNMIAFRLHLLRTTHRDCRPSNLGSYLSSGSAVFNRGPQPVEASPNVMFPQAYYDEVLARGDEEDRYRVQDFNLVEVYPCRMLRLYTT